MAPLFVSLVRLVVPASLLLLALSTALAGCDGAGSGSQSQPPDSTADSGEGGAAALPAAGGPSAGGSGTGVGGSATGGAAAVGGRAARCDEPGGDPGACDALIRAWFFDPMRGACMPFEYGGCGASINHFNSQLECEDTCGGALYSNCPDVPPDRAACDGSLVACRYTPEDCPCLQTSPGSFNCVPADAACGAASEYPTICSCSEGTWYCAARPMP